MKTNIMMIALLGLLMSGSSCKKDNKTQNPLEKSYFSIQNATFVNGAFPQASSGTAPAITSLFGNTSILEGGSNPISITTDASVKEVIIGVEGQTGYYRISASDLKSTTQTYMIYLLFSSTFAEDNFTIAVAIVDNNGLTSASEAINVSRITAGTGKLQVSVSWDKPNDLDLHLVQPDSAEIYWDNQTSETGGVLDVDSNPICYLDNINNENITYSGDATVIKGKYTVRVALFSSCSVTDLTHYVVTARMDGNLIAPATGQNPYYGSIAAADAYIDGTGPEEGFTAMTFNVSSTKSTSEKQKMLKFTYAKHPNLLKRSMLSH